MKVLSYHPRHLFSIRLACLLTAGLAAALPPLLAGTAHVARSAPENRIVLDIAPGPGNPRNSEGAFIDLKDGGILFVYSRFIGSSSNDEASACLAARVSHNGGETWSAHDRIILTPQDRHAMNVMSVSLLRMKNGDIGLFYLVRRSWHDTRMQLIRSSDEGRTWGPPVECMAAPRYYVVNNDRVIRLRSGRLVIPAAMFLATSAANTPEAVDWRGLATFFLSDDDGRTWKQSPGICTLPSPYTHTGLQEPGVVELPDGVLWAWARTDLGRQYEFFSYDQGETWTVPQPSRFTSPASPLSMKPIPGSNRFFAVWNPAPNYPTRAVGPVGGDRTPLVLATGAGPGLDRWSAPTVIEGTDGRDAGYAYTAIHFVRHAVLLAYCAGGAEDHGMLNRLRIRRIDDALLP